MMSSLCVPKPQNRNTERSPSKHGSRQTYAGDSGGRRGQNKLPCACWSPRQTPLPLLGVQTQPQRWCRPQSLLIETTKLCAAQAVVLSPLFFFLLLLLAGASGGDGHTPTSLSQARPLLPPEQSLVRAHEARSGITKAVLHQGGLQRGFYMNPILGSCLLKQIWLGSN